MIAAGLGWRAGARVVDLSLAAWLVGVTTVEIEGRLFGADPFEGVGLRFRLIAVLIVVGTEVLPVAVAGASLGKAVFGLRVVTTDALSDTVRPGVARALLRSVALYGAALIPLAGGFMVALVLAPVLFDPARRGLHDRLAGTMVIAVDRGGVDDERDGRDPG